MIGDLLVLFVALLGLCEDPARDNVALVLRRIVREASRRKEI